MHKGLITASLALGAALIAGGAPDSANAQPANCGDINGSGSVTSADSGALSSGTISAACNATKCWDTNASGGASPDPGDQVVLDRFVAAGANGNQNLLYNMCTGAPAPVACNTAGTPFRGRITSNTTFPGPGDGCSEFFIAGRVTVANNSTLTIRPGAVIKAIVSSSDPALLLVTRGSRINANGATNPIILTSAAAPGARTQGDWGGLVINGVAPQNFGSEGSSEGLPPGGDAAYGGNNPSAFSAQLRFVRIEFSGVVIGEDNELNILTMNSMGRLSQIDHVQVNQGRDDGFEWFGGTARGKYLVATGAGDDAFDWQIGYMGVGDPATTPLPAVQFGLAVMDRDSTGADPDSHGIEADNNEFNFAAQTRSAPWMCNLTLVGPRDTGGSTANTGDGARFRRGTAGRLQNSIIEKFLSNGIDYRDAPQTRTEIAGTVRLFDTGATPCTGNATECAKTTVAGSSALVGPLTYPGRVPGYCDASGNLIDNRYLLAAATPAPDTCAAASPFFDSAPYVGAFNTSGNWLTSIKPCCPDGSPYAVIGGQRCWISFDIN